MSDSDDRVEAFIPGLSEEAREHRRRDLLERARLVQRDGWDEYRYVWSSGEVAGVAYLLADEQVLNDTQETTESVLRRYAYDLYGIGGGQEDQANGFRETRLWFTQAHDELT